MKVRHEVCMVLGFLLLAGVVEAKTVVHKRHLDCKTKTSAQCTDAIRTALGDDGVTFKLKSDGTVGDVVHGAIQEVRFCDTRTVGENIQWHDGKWRVLTHENMAAYFAGQGHQIVQQNGDTYLCDTIIKVEIYEADEPPNKQHKIYKKKPLVMPSGAEIKTKLDALVIP